MTEAQREEALTLRQRFSLPWHRPPHSQSAASGGYHLSAACYEHRPVVGFSAQRLAAFEGSLLAEVASAGADMLSWSVLPNHYHLLVQTLDLAGLLARLGRLHGRTSHDWNSEEDSRGRKCWHACADRAIRSERHLWATLNYVHHNPVHHGYVAHWQEWPFSSAQRYLDAIGHELALRCWRNYPVLDYGKGWDDPGM